MTTSQPAEAAAATTTIAGKGKEPRGKPRGDEDTSIDVKLRVMDSVTAEARKDIADAQSHRRS